MSDALCETSDPPQWRAKLILIEDEETVRVSMQMLLRAKGFYVKAYISGADYLAHSPAETADCFLIDYRMPGMNGLDLVRSLRRQACSTPIILLTGYYSGSLSVQAPQAGIMHIFEKPIEVPALLSRIEELLQNRPGMTG